MELDKIKELVYNNIEKVNYEERSSYGIVDAIEDAFKEAETQQLILNGVSKRFFVAEIESKYKCKIISCELTDKQDAESFILTMKDGYTYKDSELVVLNVC
jgi:hypothetical protein